MNPISAFFVRNIVFVYFFYGLAFFALGLALALAARRSSEFRFAQAIVPLAIFGILHGIHEWIEMFQKVAALTSGYAPSLLEEIGRTAILVLSFLFLLAFGMSLLSPKRIRWRQLALPLAAMLGLWGMGLALVWLWLHPTRQEALAMADVLARYTLGIPAALLGTWALMRQQRTFREHGMPQFGRDLVWAATALLLYGVLGQIFVRPTALVPSNVLNSTMFLQWFGIPVQLFRGVTAAAMALFLTRALNAFELENRRQLQTANRARETAQAAQLEAERRGRLEVERLNQELRLTAHELAVLLDLANLLVAPLPLKPRLQSVLERLVRDMSFCDRGLIMLIDSESVAAEVAFPPATEGVDTRQSALDLAAQSITLAKAMCRHADGVALEFRMTSLAENQECQGYPSPMTMIGLPLLVQERAIGSLALGRADDAEPAPLTSSEFRLMVGAAQQTRTLDRKRSSVRSGTGARGQARQAAAPDRGRPGVGTAANRSGIARRHGSIADRDFAGSARGRVAAHPGGEHRHWAGARVRLVQHPRLGRTAADHRRPPSHRNSMTWG